MPIKAGSFRSRSTTGVDSVTGFGFAPSAIVVTVLSSDFDDTNLTAEVFAAYAISDGTTTRSIAVRDADNVTTTETARAWTSTVRLVNSAAGTVAEAGLTLEADGFELDWTTISAAQTVCYWAIGGTGIDAKVLTFTRGGTGDFSVTGAGFQPKALIGIGGGTGAPESAVASNSVVMLGMADDDANMGAAGVVTDDAQSATRASRVVSQVRFLTHRSGSNTTTQLSLVLDTLDADGFSMLCSIHPAGDRYYAVLCLGGADLTATNINVLTADTTTGAHTQTISGLPFEPHGGLLFHIGGTSGVEAATTGRLGLGAFDNDLNQWATLYNTVTSADPTQTDEGASDTSAFATYSSTDGAWDAVGEITAKDSDSIDVTWDASKTATAYWWQGLLFELDEATVIEGDAAGAFGSLTGTMSGAGSSPVTGTAAGAFGALTGGMAGSPVAIAAGTMSGTFGALTGGIVAGAVTEPVHQAPHLDAETLYGHDYLIPLTTLAPYLASGATFAPSVVIGTSTGLEVRHGTTVLEATDRSWMDPLGSVGNWSLSMHNTDPDIPDFGEVVEFWLDGQLRFAGPVVGKNATTHTTGGEAQHMTGLSGPGRLAVTGKSLIGPARGWDAAPVETTRTQSYVAVDFDDTGWSAAKRIRRVDIGVPYSPFRAIPEWYPDKTAWAVAPNRGDITGSEAPVGRWLWRSTPIDVPAGTIEIVFGNNNKGPVYWNGALIGDLENSPTDANRVRLDVSGESGNILAGSVTNFIRDTWVVASIYTVDNDGLLDDLLWSSDYNTIVALPYPSPIPGPTAGRAIRQYLEWIQTNEGELLDVTLDFTDTQDSDGQPWSHVVEITTDVGRSFQEYIESLSDWLIDAYMTPGSNTLRAWNWGTRGGTPGVTVAATTDRLTSETEGLSFDGIHTRANRLHIRYRRGYTEVDQSGSDPTVTAFLDLSTIDSEDTAQDIATQLLELRAEPSWAGRLTLDPVSSNPYDDFDNGDTVSHAANPDGVTSSRVQSLTYKEDKNKERTWAVELHDIRQEQEERQENWLRRAAMGSVAGGSRVTSRTGDPISPAVKISTKDVAEISFQDPTDGLISGKTPAKSSGNAIEIYVEVSTDGDTDTTGATVVQVTKNGTNFGDPVTVAAGETSAEVDLSAQKIYRNVDRFRAEVVTAGGGVTGVDVQIRAI